MEGAAPHRVEGRSTPARPIPPFSPALERAAQHEMHVPHRRRRQRQAAMRAAATVAFVLPRGAVVRALPVGAVGAAASQLAVERVQHLVVHRAGPDVADEGPHVLAQVVGVHAVRGTADVEVLQVEVEQLVDSRLRSGIPPLVDLAEQADPGRLGLGGRLRSRRDDLDQIVALAGERVLSGVDPHPQGPARQRVDRAARAAPLRLGPSHDTRVGQVRVTFRVTPGWFDPMAWRHRW
jgi:hypothetical protein